MVKKICLITVMALCVVGILGTGAGAAQGWYNCSVKQTGISGSYMLINLTDTAISPAFTSQWYYLEPAYAKTILAVILTAMSLSKTVWVYVDAAQPYSYISIIYLKE